MSRRGQILRKEKRVTACRDQKKKKKKKKKEREKNRKNANHERDNGRFIPRYVDDVNVTFRERTNARLLFSSLG